jgi:hypothetical protein
MSEKFPPRTLAEMADREQRQEQEQQATRAARSRKWAGADRTLTPDELRAVAAATTPRVLMGNPNGCWWVPLHELNTVSAETLRERAEAEGWEPFDPRNEKHKDSGPSADVSLPSERQPDAGE